MIHHELVMLMSSCGIDFMKDVLGCFHFHIEMKVERIKVLSEIRDWFKDWNISYEFAKYFYKNIQ